MISFPLVYFFSVRITNNFRKCTAQQHIVPMSCPEQVPLRSNYEVQQSRSQSSSPRVHFLHWGLFVHKMIIEFSHMNLHGNGFWVTVTYYIPITLEEGDHDFA